MSKKPIGRVKQIMAAGDPPLVGETPIFDRRTAEIQGKRVEQVEISYLDSMQFINVNPRDIVVGWDPHDCL